ncbi:hypothetical protein HG535_0C04880 [Zygotorulaspora mrakii]|uniref:C2H2-type domain-containing protein n=1 Tax=Zygotorulaspora mrakii TaxID=42260 RepID=A0A7H9B174_ZYGMR|nr:uncharacterized protein HG535_0C04880 [Zygotorulaspora mrakii]QLG72134.1 hypothetical protein HG535_0C04880 [Zygotorulaspora mrakii]
MLDPVEFRADNEVHPEGIVHGHIHNFDNMTFIHGHVHHGLQEAAASSDVVGEPLQTSAVAVPTTTAATPLPITQPTDRISEHCKTDPDCQHFEIINYHRNADSCGKKHPVAAKSARSSSFGSSMFSDDFLLLPSKKRKILQNKSDSRGNGNNNSSTNGTTNKSDPNAENCECHSKILEVCCDVKHPDDPYSAQKDKDAIIYTGIENNPLLHSALHNTGSNQANGNGKNSGVYANDNNSNKNSYQYAAGIPGIPEINCDLTCGPSSYYKEKANSNSNANSVSISTSSQNGSETEKEEEDIFEKFCKECLNLGLEQKLNGNDKLSSPSNSHIHHHHNHYHHKCSMDTPLSASSTSSNNSIKIESNPKHDESIHVPTTTNNVNSTLFDVDAVTNNVTPLPHGRSCHDHIVNTQMDLKILDDLCNISSLYEFPSASHLNHQNHSHINSKIKGESNNSIPQKNNEIPSESINLLESSLRGTTTNTQNNKSNQSHHHHIVQIHPPCKPCCSNVSMQPQISDNEFNLIDTNTIPYNNKNYSYERSTLQEDTIAEDSNISTLPKFNNSQKPSFDWNLTGQENNIINFNWSFKNEENNIKCKWDQCSETYSTLLDLQKHMLRDHVGDDSSPDLSCYWEACSFEGEDTCSLINHINADHGINFGMRVVDPNSLLEQRDPAEIHNHNSQECNHHHHPQEYDHDHVHNHNHQNCNHYHNPNHHESYREHHNHIHLKEDQPQDHNYDYMQYRDLHCDYCDTETMSYNQNTQNNEQQDPLETPVHKHDCSSHQHRQQPNQKAPMIQTDSNGPMKLQCRWGTCRETFDSAEALTNHLEQVHLTRGKSEYQCHWEGCSKRFTQRQKLVRHLKVHSGYKPYKCSVCAKCFSSDDTLTQHMRIHSGEKPFECPICGKKFTVSSSLKIHIRTHTGEKPLQCKICGKRFNESSNLSKHMKTHQKKYKCIFCARSFETLDRFQAHQNKCTKAHEKRYKETS